MDWFYVYIASHAVIVIVCSWAVLTPKVSSMGFVKVVIAILCFSSLACIGWAYQFPETVDQSETVFALCAALLALKCIYIKEFKPVRRAMKRKRNAINPTL